MGGNPVESAPVAVQLLHPDAQPPRYSSAEAAGADLCAVVDVAGGSIFVPAGGRKLVKTGIAIELNPGFQAEIRPRSGLALKQGITVLNTPGTIDSDYRGEIGVILFNTSEMDFEVKTGDRIAQMVIMPVVMGNFQVVGQSLSESERGAGGFGSTGV